MWLTRFALSRPIDYRRDLRRIGASSASFRSSNWAVARVPPNTDFPVVAVVASYPGASPQDMERMVIKPIEDQMAGIDHLDRDDRDGARRQRRRGRAVQHGHGSQSRGRRRAAPGGYRARLHADRSRSADRHEGRTGRAAVARFGGQLENVEPTADRRPHQHLDRPGDRADSQRAVGRRARFGRIASSTSNPIPSSSTAPTRRSKIFSTRSRSTTSTCRAAS